MIKISHTKQAMILLRARMCVAIADADALARGEHVPRDSPVFDRRTIEPLIERGIFRPLSVIRGGDHTTNAPVLTGYGEKYVDIAIEHYFAVALRKKRRRA